MKLRPSYLSYFGILTGLFVMTVSFQNCAKAKFVIDDEMKAQTLNDTDVFRETGEDTPVGDGRNPGDDINSGVGRNPGDDPNSGGRNPGMDPFNPIRNPGMDMGGLAPRIPGVDLGNNVPTNPGDDGGSGVPRGPGTDLGTGGPSLPGIDIGTGVPRGPGTDVGTGEPRGPGTDVGTGGPRDPGSDPNSKNIKFEFFCPAGLQAHGSYKGLTEVTGELKIVVAEGNPHLNQFNVKCEVKNVKNAILNSKSVDMSSCAYALPTLTTGFETNIYVVEDAVTSDYFKKKLNRETRPDPFGVYQIGYADMNDQANIAACDEVGDPLLVQLKTDKPQTILLSAPTEGVMFDLLGRRNDHQKVQVSWFADANTENYFLVLPDAQGAVNGIDELFGDNTYGPDQRYSKQGFQALAKHDDNSDRIISDDDEVFAKLKLWKDSNLDGIAHQSELFSLEDKEVVAIDLRVDKRYMERDKYGNMTKYKSVVVMKNGQQGLVYDLWLRFLIKK